MATAAMAANRGSIETETVCKGRERVDPVENPGRCCLSLSKIGSVDNIAGSLGGADSGRANR